MRLSLLAAALLLAPGLALAQGTASTSTATSTTTSKPPFTRDQFIANAEARAAKRAGAVFDKMDTNHDGSVDAGELQAWRAAHRRSHHHAPAAKTPAAPAAPATPQ